MQFDMGATVQELQNSWRSIYVKKCLQDRWVSETNSEQEAPNVPATLSSGEYRNHRRGRKTTSGAKAGYFLFRNSMQGQRLWEGFSKSRFLSQALQSISCWYDRQRWRSDSGIAKGVSSSQRVQDSPARLHQENGEGSPRFRSRWLCSRASSCYGRASWSISGVWGGCPSHQRYQRRQQDRESAAYVWPERSPSFPRTSGRGGTGCNYFRAVGAPKYVQQLRDQEKTSACCQKDTLIIELGSRT
jgi:hypothetical protein